MLVKIAHLDFRHKPTNFQKRVQIPRASSAPLLLCLCFSLFAKPFAILSRFIQLYQHLFLQFKKMDTFLVLEMKMEVLFFFCSRNAVLGDLQFFWAGSAVSQISSCAPLDAYAAIWEVDIWNQVGVKILYKKKYKYK